MKTIGGLILDLSDLPAASEVRNFTVLGEIGAVFSLEIRNEDSYYYNFTTKAFQAAKAKLDNKVIKNGKYFGSITFPTITDDDHYDIYLYAEGDTRHIPYQEVRFDDGTVDKYSADYEKERKKLEKSDDKDAKYFANYPFNTDNVKRFASFCKESGGFEIW